VDGADTRTAQAPVRDPSRWQALVQLGQADALPTYPRDLASVEQHKDCCVRASGHRLPHDVVDPLAAVVSP
jgi:hypothetical protein